MSRKDRTAYALTLKGMTDEQLFEAWSLEYSARHTIHVELIIAEMDSRHNVEVIVL